LGKDSRNLSGVYQAMKNAQWVKENLFTEIEEVNPVLLFAGKMFVEPRAREDVKSEHGVLMLNAKAFSIFLDHFPDVLSDEQVSRLVAKLSNYIFEDAKNREDVW